MTRPWPPLSHYARFWLWQAIRRRLGLKRLPPRQRIVQQAVWPVGIGAPVEADIKRVRLP